MALSLPDFLLKEETGSVAPEHAWESLLTLLRHIKMMVQFLVHGFFPPLLPETLLVFYVQPRMLLGLEVGGCRAGPLLIPMTPVLGTDSRP